MEKSENTGNKTPEWSNFFFTSELVHTNIHKLKGDKDRLAHVMTWKSNAVHIESCSIHTSFLSKDWEKICSQDSQQWKRWQYEDSIVHPAAVLPMQPYRQNVLMQFYGEHHDYCASRLLQTHLCLVQASLFELIQIWCSLGLKLISACH